MLSLLFGSLNTSHKLLQAKDHNEAISSRDLSLEQFKEQVLRDPNSKDNILEWSQMVSEILPYLNSNYHYNDSMITVQAIGGLVMGATLSYGSRNIKLFRHLDLLTRLKKTGRVGAWVGTGAYISYTCFKYSPEIAVIHQDYDLPWSQRHVILTSILQAATQAELKLILSLTEVDYNLMFDCLHAQVEMQQCPETGRRSSEVIWPEKRNNLPDFDNWKIVVPDYREGPQTVKDALEETVLSKPSQEFKYSYKKDY
jgi:hypothetical protein